MSRRYESSKPTIHPLSRVFGPRIARRAEEAEEAGANEDEEARDEEARETYCAKRDGSVLR